MTASRPVLSTPVDSYHYPISRPSSPQQLLPPSSLPSLHHDLHSVVAPKLASLSALSSHLPLSRPASILAATYELELEIPALARALAPLTGGPHGEEIAAIVDDLQRAERKVLAGQGDGDWGFCWSAVRGEVPRAVERGWGVVRRVDEEMAKL